MIKIGLIIIGLGLAIMLGAVAWFSVRQWPNLTDAEFRWRIGGLGLIVIGSILLIAGSL
jgi:hypothetical protein